MQPLAGYKADQTNTQGITSSVIKIHKVLMLLRFTENIPKMWVIQTFLSALISEEYRLGEDLFHLF